MNSTIKSLISLTLVGVLSISLSACASQKKGVVSNTKDTQIPTNQPKKIETVTLMLPGSWYDQTPGRKGVIDNINSNSVKTGIKVELDKMPEGVQGESVMKARFASNELPDLLLYKNMGWLSSNFGGASKFVELSGDWTKNFDEKLLKSNTYSIDGKLYAAPFGNLFMAGIFYNERIFKELNISIPKNYDEFLSICEKIKKSGKTPVYLAGKDAWSLQFWTDMFGSQREIDKNNFDASKINTNKAKFQDYKLWLDSITKLKALKDKGYINESFLSDTTAMAEKALSEGTAVMYASATYSMDNVLINHADKEKDIRAFILPMDGTEPSMTYLNAFSLVIPNKNNGKVEAAKQALTLLVSKESYEIYTKIQRVVVPCKGITSDIPAAINDLKKIYDSGKSNPVWYTDIIYPYGAPTMTIQEILAGGDRKPIDVLKIMDDELSKTAKAKGDVNFK